MASLPNFLPLCWLLLRAAADASISVFSELSACSSDPQFNYTLVRGTGLFHGQWLDTNRRACTHAAVDQLSAPGSMLIQCAEDADWILSWCPLLDVACLTSLEEGKELLPSYAESYRIAALQVPKFRGGHCIKAVRFHGQQQQHMQLMNPSHLRLPEHSACRVVARSLRGTFEDTTTTVVPVGPGRAFAATLLIIAITIFVALVGGVAFLNRVREWGDPRACATK